MKKQFTLNITALICAISFFYLVACKKETIVEPATANSLSTAKATTFTSNEKMPVDAIISISCANGGAGENIHLTGTIHVLIKTTVNGNHFLTKYHFQPQGVKGLGLTTGNIYQANGASQETVSGDFTNGQYSRTDINNYRIIGQGTGNNYLVHNNSHITINANGETTVSTDHLSVECK